MFVNCVNEISCRMQMHCKVKHVNVEKYRITVAGFASNNYHKTYYYVYRFCCDKHCNVFQVYNNFAVSIYVK